ncbi:hypothetical protein evm_002516 [Chilo suppressalis]|nr:hypothetical protein evm_002516 [Chilo suppressalis]
MEKALNNRLINYLERYNILSCNQFGFRSGRSTEDAVSHLVDYVTLHLDSKQKCLGVFLDLAKAFDTVSIPKLVKQLYRIGIRDNALNIFSNFLEERTQQVKLVRYLLSLESPKIFADDTALIFHGGTWDEFATYRSKVCFKHLSPLCPRPESSPIIQSLLLSPTAGAQPFPMDGIGRLGHHPPRGPSADWWVLTTADAAGTNGLTCLPKHGGSRNSKFLVTHPMTDHCESCLTSTIAAERANHLRHRAPHNNLISLQLFFKTIR